MSEFAPLHAPLILLLIGLLLATGCSSESTESTNIATRAIWAGIFVDSDRPGDTRVNVELNVGGSTGTNIELGPNERLEATVGSETKILQKDTDLFDIDYDTHFSTSSSALPFRITFYRADGAINRNSVVSLPDDFAITSPLSGAAYDSGATVPVLWAPGRDGQTIRLRVSTSCRQTDGGSVSSTASFTLTDDGFDNFSLGQVSLLSNPDIDRSQNCDMSLSMWRLQEGTLDAAFEAGGRIEATQSRTVDDVRITFPVP